jgi:flagellar hook-associated protein 1 FlgK
MGLTQALSSALSGLRVTQTGISVVATNVANAETPGYTRKTLGLEAAAAGGASLGVQISGINRELDIYAQRQLRTELAGSSYINVVAQFRSQIDHLYGVPGGTNALDTRLNSFTNSLQALASDPQSLAARQSVLNEAQVFAQQLNQMSTDIQAMRNQAESGIADAVDRVNALLRSIEDVSNQINALSSQDTEIGALLDERDKFIDELAGLVDIRIVGVGGEQIAIFTASGISLFDRRASELSFDERPLSAQSMWNVNPALRTTGTISLVSSSGNSLDLIADNAIRSGEIAGLIELRDDILVKAQAQLDEIAHTLALAMSNRTISSTAATVGAQTGFDIDLAGLQNGNAISLTFTENGGPTQRRITIVRVDDPASLPLSNSLTADPGDEVIGIDFSGGVAGALAALNAALGPDVQFSNPAGSILRVLDDGAPDNVNIDALSATVTTSAITTGELTLPFFVDGGSSGIYTDAISGGIEQKVGFAGRIAVSAALLADPSGLIQYASGTLAGDSARPDFLWQRLTATNQYFSPGTGIGGTNTPYSGTLVNFVQQSITTQGNAAENAARLKAGQDIVIASLQERIAESAGVNIDSEMARLLALQNAYAANARVLTAIKELYDLLIRI